MDPNKSLTNAQVGKLIFLECSFMLNAAPVTNTLLSKKNVSTIDLVNVFFLMFFSTS